MFKLSARSKRRSALQAASLRKEAPQKPLVVRLVRLVISVLVVLGLVFLALYFLYRTILSTAIHLPQPELILLVPNSVESKDQQVFLVQVAPKLEDSYIVNLDHNQEVELPAGYGKYKLASLYPLLKLDKHDDHFITASFSRSLGVMIDHVYGLDSLELQSAAFTHSIWQLVTTTVLQTRNIPFEVIKLWYFARQNLPMSSVATSDELHTQIQTKRKTTNFFQTCPVSVLNAGVQNGAANELATLFETSGLITIRTSTYPQEEQTTKIFHNGKAECQPVVEIVSKAMTEKPEITEDEKMTSLYRAPVVLVIGKDFK